MHWTWATIHGASTLLYAALCTTRGQVEKQGVRNLVDVTTTNICDGHGVKVFYAFEKRFEE